MLESTGTLAGTLSASPGLSGSLSAAGSLSGMLSQFQGDYQPYTGAYEVTPGTEAQTLQTADRYMSQNVTINPIPSNYGLVTWDGAALTVS